MGKVVPISDRWVFKSNRFLKAGLDWTTQMHRVVLMLISQIDRTQEDFGVQRVHISEIEEASGIENPNLYSEGPSIAQALLSQRVEVHTKPEDYDAYNLLSACRYVSGKGYIEARFNPDMREFLLGLKERYTKYLLQQVMQLSSPYSMRIYEILAMYRGIGWVDITVEELRRMFKLEDKYQRWRDLRRYVIESAQDELKEKCDLYFTFAEIRQGRRVTAVKFKIHQRDEQQAAPPQVRRLQSTDDRDAFEVWYDALPVDEQAAFDGQVKAHMQGQPEDLRLWEREMMVEQTRRELWRKAVAE